MKRTFIRLGIIIVLFLCFYNVKALDEREALTTIEATSNINSIIVYGGIIENPTFNVTVGTEAHFIPGQYDWRIYDADNSRWLSRELGYNFNSGKWDYRVQICIDGEAGKSYKLNNQTKVRVDGEDWLFSYSSADSGTDYSCGTAYSTNYILEPTGELNFFPYEGYRIFINYINTPIGSFPVTKTVEGGTEPYTFEKVSGPEWINVSATGTVSGTPTEVGNNENLVVRVTDAESNHKEITIPVDRTILTPNLREEITSIVATSNIDTIPVLDGNIVNPTFNITNIEGPFFANYNCGWYKKIGSNWVIQEEGTFTPGLWQYRGQVILEGKPAETHKLTENTTVTVDGVDWEYGLSGTGNEYYAGAVKSPEYLIKDFITSIELMGTINAPKVDNDIVEPSIGIESVNNDPYLINYVDVTAKWQYKTGDGFFDWEDATGKFEQNKTYHIRLMITVNGDVYDLANIATFPVTFEGYNLTQFQLNNKTVGEFIEFPTLNDVTVPSVSLVSDNNKVTLSWDEQSAATKYLIYRSTDGKKYTKIKEVTTNTYVQTGLTYNRTYYYKVRACDISKCSNYSNVVARKIRPNKVTLTVKSAGTNNIKLGWDRVTTTGYEVYRSTNNKKWTRVKTITKNSTLEFNNKSLSSNKLYYYKVRAYKTVSGRKVYGSWSDVVYTRTAPVKPKIAVSIRNYNEINIKLSESKGANLYIIYKSTDGKNYERVYELDAPGVTVDSGNEIGKTYYYKARVCNKYNNCSPLVSASIMQTTKVPTLSVSSTTTKKVSITVSPVEMADGYRVYRSSYKNSKYKMIKDVENLDELTFDNSTKKGYTYYYRVRSYKVVDGVRVYSPLSGYKAIKSK